MLSFFRNNGKTSKLVYSSIDSISHVQGSIFAPRTIVLINEILSSLFLILLPSIESKFVIFRKINLFILSVNILWILKQVNTERIAILLRKVREVKSKGCLWLAEGIRSLIFLLHILRASDTERIHFFLFVSILVRT